MFNKGSALLSALFIMTIVAIAATAMSARIQLEIYRSNLLIDYDKLYLASEGVTFWAMGLLENKKNTFNQANNEGVVAYFPKKLKSIYPGVISKGEIYDLQARFNLNNLRNNPQFKLFFFNLLKHLLPKYSEKDIKSIVDATANWVNRYRPGMSQDKLDKIYKGAYLPSHQLMKNISEFRLVSGINAHLFETLRPYLITLPKTTPINLNTAPPPLLYALGNGLSANEVMQILEKRIEEKGIEEKERGPLLQKLHIPNDQVTFESNYFLAMAIVSIKDKMLIRCTILERKKTKDKKFSIRILSESLNE